MRGLLKYQLKNLGKLPVPIWKKGRKFYRNLEFAKCKAIELLENKKDIV